MQMRMPESVWGPEAQQHLPLGFNQHLASLYKCNDVLTIYLVMQANKKKQRNSYRPSTQHLEDTLSYLW